jgi:hypothetical protein
VQQLLGRKDTSTAIIDAHVLNRGGWMIEDAAPTPPHVGADEGHDQAAALAAQRGVLRTPERRIGASEDGNVMSAS